PFLSTSASSTSKSHHHHSSSDLTASTPLIPSISSIDVSSSYDALWLPSVIDLLEARIKRLQFQAEFQAYLQYRNEASSTSRYPHKGARSCEVCPSYPSV
ncbi:hypothetical protein CSUI_005399, partial [Cystoisospora suis]